MSSTIQKLRKAPSLPHSGELELAELAAALAKANFLYRRLAKRLGHKRDGDKLVPDYGQVKVVAPPEEFEDISGEEGIVLGGGETSPGQFAYTVFIIAKGETYYLAGSALQFTGVIVPPKDVYRGDTLRVAVDPNTGEGRLVSSGPQQKAKRT